MVGTLLLVQLFTNLGYFIETKLNGRCVQYDGAGCHLKCRHFKIKAKNRVGQLHAYI